MEKVAAGAVHVLTASGAAWALLALSDIAAGRWRRALVWMVVAVVVDGVDGMLARRLRVATMLPSIDGALLDNVVDYANYVLVPAFFLARSELLPPRFALATALAVSLASAYQFAQTDAKTLDHYFKGFPSYWNLVVFYLLLLGLPPAANLTLVAVACALVFVPLYWVYPSRTRTLRGVTLAATAAWLVVLGALLALDPDPPRWLAWASLAYPVYYVALSLVLTARRSTR